MELIQIEDVGHDPFYYPRRSGKADWLTVHKYKECVIANKHKADPRKKKCNPFPPIIVVRRPGWDLPFMLLDGLHRWTAFRQAGLTEIWAEIKRLPQSMWLKIAFQLNHHQEHRGFDPGDKAWVAERMIADGESKEDVAKWMEMPLESLEKLRARRVMKVSQREGDAIEKRGGTVHRTNGGQIAIKKATMETINSGRQLARATAAQRILHSRTPLGVIEEFCSLLQSGVIDTKDENVVAALTEAQELLGKII